MKKNNFETQKLYNAVEGLLCAFDENVVSEEDYRLIENKKVNDESDFKYILNILLRPWFLGYSHKKREEIIQSIDCIIDDNSELIEPLINDADFIFEDKINDKTWFLEKIRDFIVECMKNDTAADESTG